MRDEVGDVELVLTEGRAGDFKGAEISGARAASELGWEARTPFAEGLRRYVAWHREHYAVEPVADLAPAAPVAVAEAEASPVAVATRSRRRVSARRVARDTGLILVGVFAALVAALAGTIGSALLDGTSDISHYAREHVLVAFVLVFAVAAMAGTAVGARRRSAQRA